MPEVFRPLASHHRRTRNDYRSESAHLGDVTSSQMDEFLSGFRDCANESLRYLAATITAEAHTSR